MTMLSWPTVASLDLPFTTTDRSTASCRTQTVTTSSLVSHNLHRRSVRPEYVTTSTMGVGLLWAGECWPYGARFRRFTLIACTVILPRGSRFGPSTARFTAYRFEGPLLRAAADSCRPWEMDDNFLPFGGWHKA